jgi:hypothetical protein
MMRNPLLALTLLGTATLPLSAQNPDGPLDAGALQGCRTSIRFVEPQGLKVSWMVPAADGKRVWMDQPLKAPATYNFAQAAIYRLKLSYIPNRPGLTLYPTLEVVPANQRTGDFLAHHSVSLSFTADDFRCVNAGNYVVKVIYLPCPQNRHDPAREDLGEVNSTQLEPGVDPIAEATRRGSIVAVVRLGNIDLEQPPSSPMAVAVPLMPMPPGRRAPIPPPPP